MLSSAQSGAKTMHFSVDTWLSSTESMEGQRSLQASPNTCTVYGCTRPLLGPGHSPLRSLAGHYIARGRSLLLPITRYQPLPEHIGARIGRPIAR